MSLVNLHLPESLLRRVHDLAERDQVSVDQFVATALAEKLSAMLTEDYLQQRAERGNRQRFEAALSSIPDVEPNDDRDRR